MKFFNIYGPNYENERLLKGNMNFIGFWGINKCHEKYYHDKNVGVT